MSEALTTTTTQAAITVRAGHQSLEFVDIQQGLNIAQTLQRSGMYPQFNTPEKIVAAITRGHELGMTPHQALSSIIQIEGRYSLSAEAMRALVLSNIKPGEGEFFIVNSSDEEATATAFRKGWPEAQTKRLTHAQLVKTNTGKNVNFQSRPRVMLSARVTSEACREWFADITGGFYTPDEVREIAASERVENAAAPAQSNLAAVKGRLATKTKPASDPAPVIDGEFARHDPETGELLGDQEPAPEHWTEENVTEWEGEFERCGDKFALTKITNALKTEKQTHPIPDHVNARLTAAYRKAKVRVESAPKPNPHPSDLEQEPAKAQKPDDNGAQGNMFEGAA